MPNLRPPNLYSAGWEDAQISEQKSFTDGRIMLVGNRAIRRPQKRADYLLRYRRDFPIAVVEAKAVYKTSGDGLQQAKEYAEILGLKFAYATNGHSIIEHDSRTGLDTELQTFPAPSELWARLKTVEEISEEVGNRLLFPYYHLSGSRHATIRKLPSTGQCRPYFKGKSVFCSRLRPARERQTWHSKSVGN
jgi:type I restriction enzyme R subunit